MIIIFTCALIGSESPSGFDVGALKSVAGCQEGIPVSKVTQEVAKLLVAGNNLEENPNRRHTSNEISAPYEVPQYPIEQIESKLNR